MRSVVVVAVALLLSACGQKPEMVDPVVDAGGDAEVDAGQVRPDFPEVSGVQALEDTNPDPAIVEVSLTAKQQAVHFADGRTLQMYTYNGVFPGPLLRAHVGDRVIVHFKNELPEATTIHWHGLRISAAMDGSPRVQAPVPAGGEFTYDFIVPDEGSFWYHPHVRTNEQVEKGLYGPIIVTSKESPTFDKERYLLLDDVSVSGDSFTPFMSGMEGMHGRYGNVLLTNGQTLSAATNDYAFQGQVERWRIVNTANARTMELSITGASFRIIATDGGPLRQPYFSDRIVLPVGQRYELEVAYTSPGTAELFSHIYSVNSSNQVIDTPKRVYGVEVFEVPGAIPNPRDFHAGTWTSRPAQETQTITLDAVNDPNMGLMWLINGQAHPEAPIFTFPKSDSVKLKIVNKQMMEHPFHLHGQFFEINDPAQPGLKDTVLVPGNSTVEVTAYFDNPGRWMAHCHILEHAELGMMSEIDVTDP